MERWYALLNNDDFIYLGELSHQEAQEKANRLRDGYVRLFKKSQLQHWHNQLGIIFKEG